MVKYQKYAEYKDSGIEWLGEIPKSWNISRLKYIAEIFGRIGFRGYTVDDIVDESEGALVLSPSNILGDQFSLDKKTYLSWKKYYESPEIMVEINDILLVKTGSTYGKSTIILEKKEPMTINPQMALLKKIKLESRFLYYLFQSTLYKAVIDISNTGSGMPTMTQENINSFPIPFPVFNEALNIANFLDYETAKIDTLIAKQEKLIELLKEKRQTMISHAVTKGLNPNVPMKDSGVEWLGKVPEHWVIGRLKNVLSIKNGRDYKNVEIEDGGYPVYGSGGIFKRSSEYLYDGISILFGRKGTVDKPLLVNGKFWTVDTMFYSELGKNVNPEYVYFQSVGFPFDKLSTNTALPSMTQEDLLNLGLAIPPVNEQIEISKFITQYLEKNHSLMEKAKQAIQLMQERRTALISAAVTGKIDVRNWQNPVKNNNQDNMELSA